MISHYPKIALRNLLKHKLFSLINIFGLAFGLAMCLLIIGNISYELSFEDIHENKNRIYRVETEYQSEDDYYRSAMALAPLGNTLKEELPEIENVSVFRVDHVKFIETQDKKFKLVDKYEHQAYAHHNTLIFADAGYFQVFTFPPVQGQIETALNEPFSLLISEKAAAEYFGDKNPIGQTVKINEKHDFKITGVLKNIPQNTQLRTDFIASYSSLERIGADITSWEKLNADFTYLLIAKSADRRTVETKLSAVANSHIGPELARKLTFHLKALKDIYFSDLMNVHYTLYPIGEVSVIYTIAVIALFILIQAIANFINLSTARSSDRMREVGIRKVLGAFRTQLIKQYIGESVIITMIATVIGLIIYEVVKFKIQPLLPRDMLIDFFGSPLMVVLTISLMIVVGLLAGLYPALYLSKFRPIEILQTKLSTKSSKSLLRKSLVVFQFAVAIFFIASTTIIHKQINHIMGINLGFAQDNIIVLDFDGEDAAGKSQTMKTEIVKSGIASSVTAADCPPGKQWYVSYGFYTSPERREQDLTYTRLYNIDYDFISTFDLKVVEGREFKPGDPHNAIIVNEAALEALEIKDPIGHKLYSGKDRFFEIIGVVENFYGTTLDWAYKEVSVLQINPERYRALAVRLHGNDISASVAAIERIWGNVFPQDQFSYSFLDDEIYHAYDDYRGQRRIFMIISMVSIFIACLGVFGLVSYTAEQKTKEIGIRKVLGASVNNIVALLSKEFLLLTIIAAVLASPAAYLLLRDLLAEFAFRATISPDIFIFAWGIALILALATISYQSIKAASANPADTLKYE